MHGCHLKAGQPCMITAKVWAGLGGIRGAPDEPGAWLENYLVGTDVVPVVAAQYGSHLRTTLTMPRNGGRPGLIGGPAISPLPQRGDDGKQVMAFRGEPVLEPRSLTGLPVRNPFQQAG